MNLNEPLLNELTHEADNTRKMLERIPSDHFTWKPHEKSMSIGEIGFHVANLPNWLTFIINQDELDLTGIERNKLTFSDTASLLEVFDKKVAAGIEVLQSASNENLRTPWKLRIGDHVIFEMLRIAVVRHMVLNHIVHHRGQLSVYLRLLNVPVPGMYGPSADEVKIS